MSAIEVKKRESESTSSLLRRFSRLIQASGLIGRARRLRFRNSPQSRRQRRDSALHREQMRHYWQQLYKLGQVPEEKKNRRRR